MNGAFSKENGNDLFHKSEHVEHPRLGHRDEPSGALLSDLWNR